MNSLTSIIATTLLAAGMVLPIDAAPKKQKSAVSRSSAKKKNKPAAQPVHGNHYEGNNYVIHFGTNAWNLERNDIRDLSEFLKNSKTKDYIVEGHADPRGSDDYNKELGQKRADAVRDYMSGRGWKTTTVSYGENKLAKVGTSRLDLLENRRVVIVPDQSTISRALKLMPADAYVADGSSSMTMTDQGSKSRWTILTEYKFEAGKDLYVFDSCDKVRKVTSYARVYPHCNTPLYDSILDVVRNHQYKSITVLTDGDDDSLRDGVANRLSNQMVANLIGEAKTKGTVINMIGIGTHKDVAQQHMMQIANETGGKHYITNKLATPELQRW